MKKILFSTVLFLFITSYVNAQQKGPVNSNYLIENGISPRVLDAAASLFMQDGRFLNEAVLIKESNGTKKEYHLEFLFDPKYKDGMDLRVVNKSNNLTKKETKQLRKYIERSHYFSRMSRDYLYDEESLKRAGKKGDTLILEYYYQKKDIDPYLKNIKRMKGRIYLIKGALYKVELENVRPLKKKINSLKKTVYYAKTNEGGYIVTSMTEDMSSGKGDKQVTTKILTKTLDHRDDNGLELTWKNKPEQPAYLSAQPDTINVKLGGVLPFLGKETTKLGYQLPRPVGVAGFVYAHNQLLEFTGLEVSFNNGNWYNLENLFALEDSKVNQLSDIYLAKADVWLFPFFNIMAMVGGGVNDLKGELVINDDLRDFLEDLPEWIIDVPNLPRSIPINSSVTSEVYGLGAIFAGGAGDFNITLNYQLLFTKIVEANTTNMVNIITPMVGYSLPFGLSVLAGAQGQFYNTQLKGYFDIEDSEGVMHRLDYLVDFEPVKWNGIFGLYIGFNKHWEMSVQIGFGQRTSLTAVFGYRF